MPMRPARSKRRSQRRRAARISRCRSRWLASTPAIRAARSRRSPAPARSSPTPSTSSISACCARAGRLRRPPRRRWRARARSTRSASIRSPPTTSGSRSRRAATRSARKRDAARRQRHLVGHRLGQRGRAPAGAPRAGRDARLAFASVGAGVEYDDNVVLRGRGVPLPSDISDESDVAGVWTANAGVELWKRDDDRARADGQLSRHHLRRARRTSTRTSPAPRSGSRDRSASRCAAGSATTSATPGSTAIPSSRPTACRASLERSWPRYGSSEVYLRAATPSSTSSTATTCPTAAARPAASARIRPSPAARPASNERHARDRDGVGWSRRLRPHAAARDRLAAAARHVAARRLSLRRLRVRRPRVRLRRLRLPRRLRRRRCPPPSSSTSSRASRCGPTVTRPRFPDPNDLVDGEEYGLPNTRKREKTTRVEVALARSLGESRHAGARTGAISTTTRSVDVFDYDQYVVGVSLTLTLAKEL